MNLKNHFLISVPTLTPSVFSHTVTYVCDHSDSGALGFIINRETNLALTEVFKQMDIQIDTPFLYDDPVHQGGPLQQDKGFVLHKSRTNHWKASLNITEDIRVTTSKDVLEDFAHNKLSKGKMLLLGYASWEAGQIEKEISHDNFWLIVPADLDIIFEVPVNQRLEAAASLIGVDLSKMVPDAIGSA
jgi:putative transcriptional regulator